MLADEICSTEKMVHFCRSSGASAFIIATEMGMLHHGEGALWQFIPAPTDHCACNDCRYMKMNTLEKLHACLKEGIPSLHVAELLKAVSRSSACSVSLVVVKGLGDITAELPAKAPREGIDKRHDRGVLPTHRREFIFAGRTR